MAKEIYKLYCDGACRGNPGPAAIGAVLYAPSGKPLAEISEYIGQATNNEAEYQALIAGIEAALKHLQKDRKDKARLEIYMDSQLVVRQIKGEYKVKNARMKALFGRAKTLLESLPDWSVQHIPRAENAVADSLANAAY